jgi:putative NADPH-quinone reductase
MGRRIVIIDGHPDPDRTRFGHALAQAYEAGAREAGHEVRTITVAKLEFALLRTAKDFRTGTPSPAIRDCQETLAWAQHWVILYPLWLGSMPALLKGFFEQVGRPGFAIGEARGRGLPRKLLTGRSARVIVTMGMPSFFYRWYYRAHSLKSLERNILAFVGVSPVRATVIGTVEDAPAAQRAKWLQQVRCYGRDAS